MDKSTILGIVMLVGVIVGGCYFMLRNRTEASVSGFQRRLELAKEGAGAERLVAGVVVAEGSVKTPGGADAVAYAAWLQVRTPGSRLVRAEHLRFEWVSFEVESAEGALRVDGTIVGLSDLVPREQGPEGEVEALVRQGDAVCVLGVVSERDGRRGFYGDVIVVGGTFEQWRAAVSRATVASIPEQP